MAFIRHICRRKGRNKETNTMQLSAYIKTIYIVLDNKTHSLFGLTDVILMMRTNKNETSKQKEKTFFISISAAFDLDRF